MTNTDAFWDLEHALLWYRHSVTFSGPDTDQTRLWAAKLKEEKLKLLLLNIPFCEEKYR